MSRKAYTCPLVVTRLRFVSLPAFAGFTDTSAAAHVDDPDLLVAAGRLDHVFTVGQDDERRVVELRAEGDEVARVVHDRAGPARYSRGGLCRHRRSRGQGDETQHNATTIDAPSGLLFNVTARVTGSGATQRR